MTKQEQRRQEWAARSTAYEASGQTMKVWCAEQHVGSTRIERTAGFDPKLPCEAVAALDVSC